MITDPKTIVFETPDDLIDYVTRGIVPSNKNFNEFINAVKNPSTGERNKDVVFITKDALTYKDTITREEELEKLLRRVYKNEVRKRNETIITAGIGLLAISAFKLLSENKKDNNEGN